MSAPATDPILLQIMTAFAAALAQISIANGFYNDVTGAGVEPLAFNDQDTYPQIVVQLESSDITDSKNSGYQDTSVLAAHGFLQIDAGTAYATALKLLDDMTRVARSITSKTFRIGTAPAPGYLNANPSMVETWDIQLGREVVPSEVSEGFLEVIVRARITYRDFSPPLAGI